MTELGGRLLSAVSRFAAVAGLVAVIGALPWLSGRDPARSILRAQSGERDPDPAALAAVRDRLGLGDGPLALFGRWLSGLARGDLGTSWVSGRPVAPTVWSAFGVSVTLMAAALVVALVVAALLMARGLARRRTTPRTGAAGAALTAVPEFLLGTLLLLVVAVWLRWAPPFGWAGPAHLVLPALALGIPAGGLLGRLADDALPGAYREPWARTWAACGLPRRSLAHGALRRCLPPLFPQLALVVVGLTGGAVTVETLFAIPGLGRIALGAATAQDLPLVQAAVLVLLALAVAAGALAAGAQRLALGPALAAAALQPPPPPTRAGGPRAWDVPTALGGTLLVIVLLGLLRDPTTVDTALRLAPPGLDAPLGRDALGRDVLARLGHGALRTVGIAAVVRRSRSSSVSPRPVPGTQGLVEVTNAAAPVLVGLLTAAAISGAQRGRRPPSVAATA